MQNVFYASANGYRGFRSYFPEVFREEDFLRLIYLKGGPGTGKSSFMKRLADDLAKDGVTAEFIRCSSDPDSLDGILLTGKNGKVGVLDATLPHAMEAKLPGVSSELVDLASAIDTGRIREKRDRLTALAKEKAASYKNGYEYLAFSENFDRKIKAEIESVLDVPKVTRHLKSLFFKGGDAAVPRNVLLSCFGKYGYQTLPCEGEVTVLSGPLALPCILVSMLLRIAEANGTVTEIYRSPLAHDLVEGFSAGGRLYLAKEEDSSDLLPKRAYAARRGELFDLDMISGELRAKAKMHFGEAARLHAGMEAIYTPAMDFGKVELMFEKTKEKLAALL